MGTRSKTCEGEGGNDEADGGIRKNSHRVILYGADKVGFRQNEPRWRGDNAEGCKA